MERSEAPNGLRGMGAKEAAGPTGAPGTAAMIAAGGFGVPGAAASGATQVVPNQLGFWDKLKAGFSSEESPGAISAIFKSVDPLAQVYTGVKTAPYMTELARLAQQRRDQAALFQQQFSQATKRTEEKTSPMVWVILGLVGVAVIGGSVFLGRHKKG